MYISFGGEYMATRGLSAVAATLMAMATAFGQSLAKYEIIPLKISYSVGQNPTRSYNWQALKVDRVHNALSYCLAGVAEWKDGTYSVTGLKCSPDASTHGAFPGSIANSSFTTAPSSQYAATAYNVSTHFWSIDNTSGQVTLCISGTLVGVGHLNPPSCFSENTAPLAQADPHPFLVCGEANLECSYILWDDHGSRGFVVPGVNMNFPIDDSYVGFKYCMNAAPPHAPMPKWPECSGHDGFRRKSGVIGRGKNG